MKNNVVEILNFLLKKYVSQHKSAPAATAVIDENIMRQLESSGFTENDVQDAFAWFINLVMQQNLNGNGSNIATKESDAVRLFVPVEMEKIGEAGCSFILFLGKIGVLNSKYREIVITQLLQMPQLQCSLEEVKWVVLMVLLSQNDKKMDNQMLEKYALYLGSQYEC